MKIEAELIKDDYKKYHQYLFFKYRKTYLYYIVIFAIFILLVWPRDEPSLIGQISQIIFPILMFFVLYGVFSLIFRIFRKIIRNEYNPTVGKHTFELGGDTFSEENARGTTQIKYSSIKHIGITKNHVFVIMNNDSGFLIPKCAFEDREQESKFIERLNQKMAST